MEIAFVEELYEAKAFDFTNQGFKFKYLVDIRLIRKEVEESG